MKANSIPEGVLSLRTNTDNDRHHLYRNNRGNWWIHYTIHLPDYTVHRVRRSLGTRKLAEARQLRDAILQELTRKEAA